MRNTFKKILIIFTITGLLFVNTNAFASSIIIQKIDNENINKLIENPAFPTRIDDIDLKLYDTTNNQIPIFNNNNLADFYVDDDADPSWYNETNYKIIKEAIENASGGDIIFVYSGTYCETFRVYRPVNIYGEDKNNTIIDGENLGNVVQIIADKVCFSGFTIKRSGNKLIFENSGIEIKSNENIIYDNIITENVNGININGGSGNKIVNNIIIKNKRRFFSSGISLLNAHENIITRNEVKKNGWTGGIYLYSSNNNIINNNLVLRNMYTGISIMISSSNNITKNNIIGNGIGVQLYQSIENNVTKNNFIFNRRQSSFKIEKIEQFKNTWDQNYWNRPKLAPHPIFGSKLITIPFLEIIPIPLVKFDWHPALKPYDI
ncbi:MAG: right-handed parallel beta-helix repeat-containing protein [Thermoplasmatales archaeon]|nr:right-handed parallel beta-helix repeat-containing protein [Thermoplasmatales archaeon]